MSARSYRKTPTNDENYIEELTNEPSWTNTFNIGKNSLLCDKVQNVFRATVAAWAPSNPEILAKSGQKLAYGTKTVYLEGRAVRKDKTAAIMPQQ